MERRFYCPELSVNGGLVELPDDESHHISRVLRGRAGDSVVLLDGQGRVANADIVEVPARRGPVLCRIQSVEQHSPAVPQIRVYVAPPRGKGMPGIIRAATELGVARITPIVCDRATSRPEAEVPESWISAAVTAIKQSINPFLPKIDDPVPLVDILNGTLEPGYIGSVPGRDQPLAMKRFEKDQLISLFIGPEGGFTDEETDKIVQKGIQPVRFGPYVLRVETAVIAGLAWVNQAYDFN